MVFEKKVFKTPNEIISKHRIKTFQNTENGLWLIHIYTRMMKRRYDGKS